MLGVDSVATEFEAFGKWLTAERSPALARIEGLGNGFEGWIKLEFFFWLTSHRAPALRPWAPGVDGDVGLEYTVRLDQRFWDMDRQTKQCDIWVRANDTDSPRYHYLE